MERRSDEGGEGEEVGGLRKAHMCVYAKLGVNPLHVVLKMDPNKTQMCLTQNCTLNMKHLCTVPLTVQYLL